jgi:hypothetical protein
VKAAAKGRERREKQGKDESAAIYGGEKGVHKNFSFVPIFPFISGRKCAILENEIVWIV